MAKNQDRPRREARKPKKSAAEKSKGPAASTVTATFDKSSKHPKGSK